MLGPSQWPSTPPQPKPETTQNPADVEGLGEPRIHTGEATQDERDAHHHIKQRTHSTLPKGRSQTQRTPVRVHTCVHAMMNTHL